MAHPPLHFGVHRKTVAGLTPQKRTRLRQLIDTYIVTRNPVGEHLAALSDMSVMLHEEGFLAWHMVFVGRLENWLITNGGAEFVPLPYWDPATPIPPELDKNNNNPNMPLPAPLRPGPVANIPDYMALNALAVPYHNAVHNNMGGQMPFPASSPSDPIFWPYHAFLVAVYEHWRNH